MPYFTCIYDICLPKTLKNCFVLVVVSISHLKRFTAYDHLWTHTDCSQDLKLQSWSKFDTTTPSIGSLSQEQEEIEPALEMHFVTKGLIFIRLRECPKATVLYFLSYYCYWHKKISFYNSFKAWVNDKGITRKFLQMAVFYASGHREKETLTWVSPASIIKWVLRPQDSVCKSKYNMIFYHQNLQKWNVISSGQRNNK